MKKQTETEIKERVLKIFRQCRSKADAPFDESHFMDFLLYPPAKKTSFAIHFSELTSTAILCGKQNQNLPFVLRFLTMIVLLVSMLFVKKYPKELRKKVAILPLSSNEWTKKIILFLKLLCCLSWGHYIISQDCIGCQFCLRPCF